MRAKKLGRHELLSWVNSVTQSDYPKIESLSDGIAFCQIIDCFYENCVDLTKLKCMYSNYHKNSFLDNSRNQEDYEKNLTYLNDGLNKIKTLKQIDPIKFAKGKFTTNFEFLQILYDHVSKCYGSVYNIKYNAYEKRVEALKHQFGSKIKLFKT